ncbi:undecaprenyldiphospho-muramoylpentapeptide beta-N-acetylglucosaminyltransferase [Devosia sp. ZB163]|nr:undecaprenyldiphospho-muramoylpentapeptide beta-N-acetylglucosaminyltransferase [Devosia sp. ZB163]MDC9825931.1 undecaprenyldiphospho-muramoylpentapeptide beta-N-acetylglucosaminyltransferase [Devosia sp. ZB163]
MSRFVLMAGGTGGHLFPAMALAQELRRRGHDVQLMTDHRVESYGGDFPASATHVVPSATPSVRNPVRFVGAGLKIVWGIGTAFGKLGSIKPDAVVGFGGYPVFPPFVAASLRGIPGLLHEQNAVMGRANRALASMARAIGLTFPRTAKAEAFAAKSEVVGNPIRDRVRAVARIPYPALEPGGVVRLLVFGGSQGARAFADLVPPAVATLPVELRSRLLITQQCRPEDLDRVAESYRQAKVNVELAPFFNDLPERMAASHLVICRSGASTVAELTAIGRPAILVPLPGAIDADQKNNALVIEAAGGGWIAEQATLTPQSLGTRLASLLGDPDALESAAAAAKSLGQPDAVIKLADLAERLAARGNRQE